MDGYENANLPGIDDIYISHTATTASTLQTSDGIFTSINIFFLFLVLLLGGIAFKMRKKKIDDDAFIKTTADDKGILQALRDPFNRKRDKDDDFDKVL